MSQGLDITQDEYLRQRAHRNRATRVWESDKPDGTAPPPRARLGFNGDAVDLEAIEKAELLAARAAQAKAAEVKAAAREEVDEAAGNALEQAAGDIGNAQARDAYVATVCGSMNSVFGVAERLCAADGEGGGGAAAQPAPAQPRAARFVYSYDNVANVCRQLQVLAPLPMPQPAAIDGGAAPAPQRLAQAPDTSLLNPEQLSGIEIFDAWFKSSCSAPPPRLLIHGPPGTGKTFFVEHLNKLCIYHGARLVCGAFAASAALLLPNGSTLHSAFSLPLGNGSDAATLPKLAAGKLAELQLEFSDPSKPILRILVLDEVSMIGASMIASINRRLQAIYGCEADWGGLAVVMLGDFLQIQPVGGKSLAAILAGPSYAAANLNDEGRRLFFWFAQA